MVRARVSVTGLANTVPGGPEIRFRGYRPQDREALVALLAQGRVPGFANAKRAVFDWQFGSREYGADGPQWLIGAAGEEIVAVMGFMPVTVKLRGATERGCWCVDLYVSQSVRGRGLGEELIARAARFAPVMLVYGISDMGNPIFDKLGWPLDTSMATMFRHCDEAGCVGAGKNALSLASRLLRWRPSRRAWTRPEWQAAPGPGDIDVLWSRVQAQFGSAVQRTGAYMTWRYADAPHQRYRWLAARRRGELAAILLSRHDPIESVIADYVGPLDEPGMLADLCASASDDLIALGTRRIRCETTSPVMKAALARSGFVSGRKSGRFRLHTNVGPPWSPAEHWFAMTGDSDNDLLVL